MDVGKALIVDNGNSILSFSCLPELLLLSATLQLTFLEPWRAWHLIVTVDTYTTLKVHAVVDQIRAWWWKLWKHGLWKALPCIM